MFPLKPILQHFGGNVKQMAKESTKERLKKTNYSIGLDIGTNSVGWAVVDDNMNLVKRCKKHLWGSRLFDTRETAEKRRKFRGARRRLLRRRIRIAMLNKIFADFIGDENFFVRMQESFLQKGDRSLRNKDILFDEACECTITKDNGERITISSDSDFYKLYPTIYHLRMDIMAHPNWQFDPKLIYLAVHHILKNRGNFINEDMATQGEKVDLLDLLSQMLNSACDILDIDINEIDEFSECKWIYKLNTNAEQFLAILQDNALSKKEQKTKIESDFDCKKDNKEIVEIFKMLVGYKFGLSNIFPNNCEDKTDYDLSSADADEKIASANDFTEFLTNAKNLYSNIEYDRIMRGKTYISEVMIERYNRYKQQLKDLKSVFLAIYPKQNGRMHPEYRKFFRDLKTVDNYARYTYSANSCEEKNFKEFIEKVIINNKEPIINGGICLDDNQSFAQKAKKILICMGSKLVEEDRETIFTDIELTDFDRQKEAELGFLQRPRVAGNGIFPKQAHEAELNKILKNQGQTWSDFLNGETQNKIKDLFNFKIDYFVGPLGIRKDKNQQNFGWLVRKEGFENEPITPFNYDNAIDFEKTRTEFIERMTGTCSYMIGEKALPKNSMFYSYFNVLNELANISVIINNKPEKLSKLSNQSGMGYFDDVINRLLETNTYKQKDLLNLLSHYYENVSIRGLADSEKLNSNLKPIRDMARIVCGKMELSANTIMEFLCSEKAEMCENIIRDITIFGESKKSLGESLHKYDLTDKQINELCALKYTGWGNLSKKLIYGIKSQDTQHLTILELMDKERKNFMSIYSDQRYGFDSQVKQELEKCSTSIAEKIEELACSPSVKRGITQAFKVAEELVSVMGHAPQNMFIEFARGEDKSKKGKISTSRQKQLKKKYDEALKSAQDLYKQLISDNNELKSNLNNLKDADKAKDFDNEKVVLYYLQAGKCMYTGEPLYLDRLNEYEVDHIVPRSLITDNSFENKALVKKYANQEKQDSEVVPNKFKQYKLWQSLKTLKFLSNEKYMRLARTELTDRDKAGFIKRQIVETSQIVKNTAILLDSYFKNKKEETHIYSIKAGLNSEFRKQFGYPKGEGGRAINDLHHAKDAYITTIMGNYLLNKWTLDNVESLHTSGLFYNAKSAKSSQNGLLLWCLKQNADNGVEWKDDDNLTTKMVLNNFDRNYYSADCFFTKKINSKPTGEFYDQTKYKNVKNAKAWGENYKSSMVTLGKKKFGKELDPAIYGGYSSINPSIFAVLQKQTNKGFRYEFIGIPTMIICPTSTMSVKEYLQLNYPNHKIVRFIPQYAVLEEETFGKAIISGISDKYCANQLKFSRRNKELYKFTYLVFKYFDGNKKFVNYMRWLDDGTYPILSKDEKELLTIQKQKQYAESYVLDCVSRFKTEYIGHLRSKYIRKDYADVFEPYFDEMLSENADLNKMLAIIPDLLKVTQCNGARASFKDYSTQNTKLSGEYGRITVSIKDWENTYIIHNSITGIYSKKEKIIKNTKK